MIHSLVCLQIRHGKCVLPNTKTNFCTDMIHASVLVFININSILEIKWNMQCLNCKGINDMISIVYHALKALLFPHPLAC